MNDNNDKIIHIDNARDKGVVPSEPILNLPPMVKLLCALIALPALILYCLPADTADALMYDFAFVPGRYAGDLPFGWQGVVSPITHMFLHGGFLHLAVNAAMLMAFGSALEKNIGGRKFLMIYFASGLFGAAVQAMIDPYQLQPLIGASGAISGLFGAVVMWMYEAGMIQGSDTRGVKSLMPLVLIWIATSVFFGLFGVPGNESSIAWVVHIAGFVAGLSLFRPVMRHLH